ncbi:MAG: hypothetical protein GY953_47530, partial [bacterium]|nr:hypothetical protein [bacterium]
PVLEDIRHGMQFDRATGGRKGIANCAATATAAAHQGEPDRVSLSRMDAAVSGSCGQGRGGGEASGVL